MPELVLISNTAKNAGLGISEYVQVQYQVIYLLEKHDYAPSRLCLFCYSMVLINDPLIMHANEQFS